MIPAMFRSARMNDRGTGALDLVLVAAFVLIPVAMLLLSLPILVEYRSVGDAAAREAVRACATAFDPLTGQERAEKIAYRILGERGLSPEGTAVEVDCLATWGPGRVVTATVSFEVPAFNLIGIWSLGSVTIDRTYQEQIEPYRSAP